MTVDELGYRAEESLWRMMNPLGLDAMMNADKMMRKTMGFTAFESMQSMNGIAETTANHLALEPMQSALENVEAIQTILKQAMMTPSLGPMHTAFEMTVNSPVLEAMKNEDRILAGLAGCSFECASKPITALEGAEGIASLKDGLGKSLLTGLMQSISPVGAAFTTSSMDGIAKELIESPIEDYLKGTSYGLAISSFGEDVKKFGLVQDISPTGDAFAVSLMNSEAKGLIEPSFRGDFKDISLGLAAESPMGELMKSTAITGLNGFSFEEASKKWEDAMPKIATANPFSETEVKPLPEPMLIMPERIEFELPDLLPIPPISREVTLSDETIEKLAEKLAEKGSRVIVIAKNKGVAIMGNASSDIINTGDHISDKGFE